MFYFRFKKTTYTSLGQPRSDGNVGVEDGTRRNVNYGVGGTRRGWRTDTSTNTTRDGPFGPRRNGPLVDGKILRNTFMSEHTS